MLSNIRNINLSQVVNHINNPNYQTGTLIEEIPTDFGRAYAGYKRGGILEGAEKFRKEVIAAAIWLFGIPAFNKLGDTFCEKILNIPMNIGYSNSKDGRDAIEQSVEYIKRTNPEEKLQYLKSIGCEWMDVSGLAKYGKKFKDVTPKKIKGAKQVTSILAWVLNCTLMGIVLPKVNQKITANKLKKQQEKTVPLANHFVTMDEFRKNNKKENVSFTGSISMTPDRMAYGLENSNTFRLVSTDVPMIIGRIFTARNKYEALEIAFMDTVSIYFYNFCANHIQKGLRNAKGVPNINPIIADYIAKMAKEDREGFDKILNNLPQNKDEIKPTLELFNNNLDIQRKIYKDSTYGKYGKLNKFVKDDELKDIDKTVNDFLRKIKNELLNDNSKDIEKIIKNINLKNAGFLACGLGASILGLAVIVPKLTFLITKLLTGKNEFSGIADYDKK